MRCRKRGREERIPDRMAALSRRPIKAMAEWFKAAVLTRGQEAEANIDEVDGPEGVKGRMPGIKLP